MDQTPLHFSYQSLCTLEKRGKRTINVRKSSSQTKRATAALTVTAAGDFFTPMIIFKGKPDGLIARRELPTLNPTSILRMPRYCVDGRVLHAHLDGQGV